MKPEQYEMVLELLEFAKRNDMFYLTTREFREFEMEVEYACEKEIAKSYDIGGNTSGVRYYCPECGVKIDIFDNCCFNCGQRIDWSVGK